MDENAILKEVKRIDLNDPDADTVVEVTAGLISMTARAISALAEAIPLIITAFTEVFNTISTSITTLGSSKRVVWLATHAKKKRIRKKNQNRIRKTNLSLMKQIREQTTSARKRRITRE